MRIWSVHPKYLDAKGLVAVWREGLLAQKVLEGKTRGYRNHPQLVRFMSQADPLAALADYLQVIADEAKRRGYAFEVGKIKSEGAAQPIPLNRGQLLYEWEHFKARLLIRDPQRHKEMLGIAVPETHPLFTVVVGDVENWEQQS
jgi:hypothetical protein